jgi:hypothetical protein
MRILATRVGLASLIAIVTATGVFAQNQPVINLGGTDQGRPEAPIRPVSGLTLDSPRELNLNGGALETQSRPSDGLGLQIYGGGSPATPPTEADGERQPDSQFPGR